MSYRDLPPEYIEELRRKEAIKKARKDYANLSKDLPPTLWERFQDWVSGPIVKKRYPQSKLSARDMGKHR